MIYFPVSDVLDRYSILCLKLEFTNECSAEHAVFKAEYDLLVSFWHRRNVDLEKFFNGLLTTNRAIWQLESNIRCGKEECGSVWKDMRKEDTPSTSTLSTLVDIGINALHIRDLNRERKAIMCQVVEATKEGWKDIKVNHSSV